MIPLHPPLPPISPSVATDPRDIDTLGGQPHKVPPEDPPFNPVLEGLLDVPVREDLPNALARDGRSTYLKVGPSLS